MLKFEDNPPLVWPQAESLRQFEGQWWVAHTKSRNEKALAHDLMVRNVSYFLPMTWKVRRQSHRTIKSLLPLFTGYLFFCGNENGRIELLKTNRVASLIEVKDQASLVDELVGFERALRAGAPLIPHKYIAKGQWCRVIAGPLLGLEGIVVQTRSNTRLVLQIDLLGQSASVEIDMDMIEPVEKQPQSKA
ncbi:MAG TPA: transcription termination/antitermination NusG family protein [Sedimentisphaerales bacterium]|nr:transcription termination/antitermination NusG family protein [Sedimentisphaerales bacterium]